jgi:hypothetical protein
MKDVFFKNELFRPNTANSAATLKKMADSNAMEGEIIDAIINKLSDIEDEMKAQEVLNTALLAGMAVLLAAVVFLMTRKRN